MQECKKQLGKKEYQLISVLERKVTNIGIADVSALGAAYLAGLSAGVYQSIEQLKTFNQGSISTLAGAASEKVQAYYKVWKKVIG